jgi:hypothetical protein
MHRWDRQGPLQECYRVCTNRDSPTTNFRLARFVSWNIRRDSWHRGRRSNSLALTVLRGTRVIGLGQTMAHDGYATPNGTVGTNFIAVDAALDLAQTQTAENQEHEFESAADSVSQKSFVHRLHCTS